MLITRPAIMFSSGETVEGLSYSSIINIANKLSIKGDKIHGFMTSPDEFVLPMDAAKIAFEAGQIPVKKDILEQEDISKVALDE